MIEAKELLAKAERHEKNAQRKFHDYQLTGDARLHREYKHYDELATVYRLAYTNQIEEDEIILEEWQDGRLLRSARTEEKLTWYHPREIRSLIREAGLSIRWESDRLPLDGQAHPIGPDADNMIFCCEIREPISTDAPA